MFQRCNSIKLYLQKLHRRLQEPMTIIISGNKVINNKLTKEIHSNSEEAHSLFLFQGIKPIGERYAFIADSRRS